VVPGTTPPPNADQRIATGTIRTTGTTTTVFVVSKTHSGYQIFAMSLGAGNGTFMDLPCARRNKSRIKSGVLLIGTEYLNTVGRIGNLLVKILPSLLPFSKWFGLWVKQQVANRVRQRRVYFKWVRV